MKIPRFIPRFAASLLIGCLGCAFSACTAPSGITEYPGFTFYDAEEFNQCDGTAPDSARWSYEVGFIRGYESQYYTDNLRKNARIENGCLILEAHREKVKNPAYSPEKKGHYNIPYAEYSSASVHSGDKWDIPFGRIDVRAKIPQGQGVFPAIWMMGVNRKTVGWPKCGEIDIMEYVECAPGTIWGTLHFFDAEAKNRTSKRGGLIKCDTLHSEFHLYSLIWDKKRVTFLFDNVPYKTVDTESLGIQPENPFKPPFYLILNLAVGGNWGGAPDPAIWPRRMEIDYIRLYTPTPEEK